MNARRGKGKTVQWLRDHADHADREQCLIWPFYRIQPGGYGHFMHEQQTHYAHRFMCELVNGPAPSPTHQAAHSCGRGHEGCVNPQHLLWKTVSENQRDRVLHGTSSGDVGCEQKLTPVDVDKIRALKGQKTQVQIAEQFGVSRGCIQYWLRHDKPKRTREPVHF